MSAKTAGSLTRIAGLVAIATAASKVMGLARQLLIADLFGAGEAYSAFGIAYILPGFLLVLLGGLNGPFHSAVVSILKKRQGHNHAVLVETLSTLSALALAVIAIALAVAAKPIIFLLAPGASPAIRDLAAQHLRIMAPLAVLSGQIGIGFGALNASEHYLLPSISPLLSSLAVIVALVGFGDVNTPTVLAWGVLAGGIAQWAAQLPLQRKFQLTTFCPRFDWKRPEVRAVVALVIPAIISSGTVHINVYTDIFFASFIPSDRTIGNLAYAQLLYLTPLGILSNAILVPLMPYYAQLAVPDRWPEFRLRIRQGLVVVALGILPCAMLLGVLARPIVRVVYQRGAFDSEATVEVAALLGAYAIGMLFYLSRDVLVRIYYALEDSRTPLRISVAAIAFNAIFDAIGIHLFGAPGLALSTAGVNLVAAIWLGRGLQRHIGPWPWQQTLWDICRLLGVVAIAAAAMWQTSRLLAVIWPDSGAISTLVQMSLAGGVGLLGFVAGALWLRLPEVNLATQRLQQFILRR
ncbi:murein biosynthesis integral membrane protein MurJ [Synechococcus sp. PCC 7336]|uniref:murein biosynthesis integral membrane protein MurJ n=1 Tax=Synechococcus sp. PCC 7336 TaxID=195250 RepID=UPI000344D1B0|nr:murein biosynthesis integral membrane protein MurJ [Synechococcus sp. PCC 7336]